MRLYGCFVLLGALALACDSSAPAPALNVSLRPYWRAPWRGTAWENPDSIRAGISRGECWPFVEDSILWNPCVERADSLMLFRGHP